MASIGPILTIIGSIILVLLKSWQDGQPQRAQEDRNEEIQKGRADIANGNAAAVALRIDSVQPVQAAGAGSAAGVGADPDGEGDARTLARLAALGCSTGEAAGGSGGLPG